MYDRPEVVRVHHIERATLPVLRQVLIFFGLLAVEYIISYFSDNLIYSPQNCSSKIKAKQKQQQKRIYKQLQLYIVTILQSKLSDVLRAVFIKNFFRSFHIISYHIICFIMTSNKTQMKLQRLQNTVTNVIYTT